MNSFTVFLENHLGEIEYGWSKGGDGQKLPFQIVKFSRGPFAETVTYTTLGLSNEKLISPVSNKRVRQELVFISYKSVGDLNIPAIMQQVALSMLKNKKALLRGDVIGPHGDLFTGSELEALYVTLPVYFPDSFKTFIDSVDTPIVMSWIVPITPKEASFISADGWDRFESILEEVNPDLIDFKRKSIF